MPELPEVESIRIQLERFLTGHVLKNIDVRNIRYELEDKDKLYGSKVTGVRRFGKALVIDLSNKISIVIHVKMTGQFIYKGPHNTTASKGKSKEISKKVIGGVPGKHTHVIFNLDGNGVLYFNDYRRFGWMQIIQTSEVKNQKFIKKLGPEFLKDLTTEAFIKILSGSKKPIKLLLMDQEKMAGVGNIYANDALFLAGINPQEKCLSLSISSRTKLFRAIETVLKEGIKRGGASELAFVTPDGGEGNYQNFTLVYGKENRPCGKCSTPIRKIKLGGRGTYFCPVCQKSRSIIKK